MKTLLGAAALLVIFILPQAVQAQYLTGNLQPGPHEVGFQVHHEYDFGRTYAPDYMEDGVPVRGAKPRPMQIGIWYPAERSGQDYMQIRDYFYLDATVEDFSVEIDEAAKLALDQQFQYQNVFTGVANPDILHRTLEMETRALRDAQPADGKFPLVVYSPREYRGIHYNTQMIEYLVSHGYVVVATPNKDQVDAVNQSQVTTDILLTNLADLQFAKAFASRMDNVDADRVGVIGWAWGAMPAMALSLTDSNISGMVSLDGGIRFQGQRQVAQPLAYFQAANLKTPVIHFETTNIPQPQAVDYTFHDAVKYADAHHYKLHDAWWFSMSSHFNLVHGKGVNDPTRFDYEAIDRNHDFVMDRTLAFLDYYVAGSEEARAELMSDAPDGVRAEVRRSEGIAPPPTEAYFTKVFNADPESAVALWDRVKQRDPSYVIATPNTLNAIGYAMIGQGETESAILALKLQADTYSWMANAWDSLGEGYMANGDGDLAIDAFMTSLTLNPPQNVKDNSTSLLGQLGHDLKAPVLRSISQSDVTPFIGAYDVPQAGGATQLFDIVWTDGKLLAKASGQPDFELIPQSDRVFWASQGGQMIGMTVEFVEESGAIAMQVTAPQSNQPVVGSRVTS